MKSMFYFILATLAVSCYADDSQSLYDLLARDLSTTCQNYSYNGNQLIPEYYKKGQIDSLLMVLDIWEDSCGIQPNAQRIRTLFKIIDGYYHDNPFDSVLEGAIINFIDSHNVFGYYYMHWSRDNIWQSIEAFRESRLIEFIDMLAGEAIRHTDSLTFPHLYCLHIQGNYDMIFEEVQSPSFAGSRVQEEYFDRIRDIEAEYNKTYLHYSFISGIWMPQGANELLGNHPQMGASAGLIYKRHLFDLVFLYRFLNSKESYMMQNGVGDMVETKNFNSFFFGVDYHYNLFNFSRYAFDLTAGFGYDGFYGIAGNDEDSKAINSFNLNIGHKSRLFLDKYKINYIGIQGQYNIVWYSSHGGSDLSGNTLSITLSFGRYPKPMLKDCLKAMQYKN